MTGPAPPSRGLDRVEVVLFLFGVAAFAVLMLLFQDASGSTSRATIASSVNPKLI